MKPLPMPIRVAAGLVATALEEAQELPRKLTELPVTAVSQALQVSMRLQQRVTDLAIKGDRALGSLRPTPESPSWARFDEDEEPVGYPRNGTNGPYPADAFAPRPPKVTPVRLLPDPLPEPESDASDLPVPREPTEPSEYPVEPAVDAGSPPDDGPSGGSGPESGRQHASSPAGGPAGLEGYEEWTLAQLRARFRALDLDQLHALLAWETEHRDRPPYVTMLSNRIASVTGR